MIPCADQEQCSGPQRGAAKAGLRRLWPARVSQAAPIYLKGPAGSAAPATSSYLTNIVELPGYQRRRYYPPRASPRNDAGHLVRIGTRPQEGQCLGYPRVAGQARGAARTGPTACARPRGGSLRPAEFARRARLERFCARYVENGGCVRAVKGAVRPRAREVSRQSDWAATIVGLFETQPENSALSGEGRSREHTNKERTES